MSSEQQQAAAAAAASAGPTTTTNNAFRPSNDPHPYDNSMSIYPLKPQPIASTMTGTMYSGPPAKYLNQTPNNYMRPMVAGQKYLNYNGAAMQQQQQRRQNNSTGVENATNDLVK